MTALARGTRVQTIYGRGQLGPSDTTDASSSDDLFD